MAMSPRWLKRNLFYFVTFLDSSSSRWPKGILRNATARVSSRGMVIAWPLAALAIHCRGVGNGVSQCKFVGIATCTRKGPCPTCRCRLHKRPRGQSVRRMGSRNRFLLALFQGIHFLPQGFKDADPRRYNYQHRTRQDHRALADSDKVHRDVPPMVRFSSACGFRYSCSARRRRRQPEKSTRGSRSVFCSAMADVSMQMPTK